MDSLSDNYIRACVKEGPEPFDYVFEHNDLEKLPKRRTSTIKFDAAYKKHNARYHQIWDDIDFEEDGSYSEERHEKTKKAWIQGFLMKKIWNSLCSITITLWAVSYTHLRAPRDS